MAIKVNSKSDQIPKTKIQTCNTFITLSKQKENTMSQKFFTILFLGVLIPTTFTFAQPYQLQLQNKAQDIQNDSFLYRITETTDFLIKSSDGIEKNKEQKIADYQFIFQPSFKTNIQNIKVTVKDIYIEKEGTTQSFAYNSKGDNQSSNLTKGYEKLIGHYFNISLDSIGQMNITKDFNTVFEEDFSSADIFDNTNFDALKIEIKQQFSNSTFEQAMRYFAYPYQVDSVNIGESWEIIDTIYPNFGVLSTMTYTLKEVKNNIALIEIKSNLSKDPNFKGIDMDMMHLKFNLQGQQEGLVLLDIETGWVRKMSIAQKLTGSMTVFFIDPQGINLKIELEGTIDYDMIHY